MQVEYDKPTYPGFGKIYPGDYYEELPFDQYIDKNQVLPEGGHVFDIRDFGAVAETDRLNTEAFHKASKACEEAGGGTILVAGGSYRMGTVWIPSNTTLFIAADSEIEASRNADLLIEPQPEGHQKYGTESVEGAFVRAKNATNIKITGGGRISGSGEWYVYEPRELPALEPFGVTQIPRRDQAAQINSIPGTIRYFYRQRIRYAEDKYQEGKPNLRRPSYMVWMENCTNVTFDNIILYDAMTWTLNLDCCDDVNVRNMVIDDNRHVANTDGIDVTGCKNVKIEHCFISCADDGICLKNPVHTHRSIENVTVRDCVVVSVMNAFKIGTGTRHNIENVVVEDCHFCMPDIYPGSVSGFSIESCDGTHLKNVHIKNITMDKVVCPIYILLNKRNEAGDPYTDTVGENAYWGGTIENITFEDIKATDIELPSIITGYVTEKNDGTSVRKAVKNVRIVNFEGTYRDNEEVVEVPEVIDELLVEYPENNAHGDVDAYGIWARHVDGLELTNVQIQPRNMNKRSEISLHDVL